MLYIYIYLSLFTASTSMVYPMFSPKLVESLWRKASFWLLPSRFHPPWYTFVDNKIAGKWMMIPPTMALFDPHFSYKNIM